MRINGPQHYCTNIGAQDQIKYDKKKGWVYIVKTYNGAVEYVPIEFCPKCGDNLSTNLKRFIVHVREIWIQSYEVFTTTKEEAIELVESKNGSIDVFDDGEFSTEFSHVANKETWTVEELPIKDEKPKEFKDTCGWVK